MNESASFTVLPPAAAAPAAESVVPIVRRALLLVDDNQSVLATLKMQLDLAGFTVHTAESGPAALALLQTTPVDAALIDLYMPGMNGVQLCREMHAHAARTQRPIRIWMMTGAHSRDAAAVCVAAGAASLVRKPFECNVLATEIDQSFSRPPVLPAPVAPPAEAAVRNVA